MLMCLSIFILSLIYFKIREEQQAPGAKPVCPLSSLFNLGSCEKKKSANKCPSCGAAKPIAVGEVDKKDGDDDGGKKEDEGDKKDEDGDKKDEDGDKKENDGDKKDLGKSDKDKGKNYY